MIRNIFILIFICAMCCGCNEMSPEIPCLSCEDNGGGGGPDEVIKKVLIEEFTGVQCVNCPQGAEEIENLISIHGDKLIAISIHAGFFSTPYPENLYDFRTSDGDNLESYLGPVSAFPAGVVDRFVFSGEQNEITGQAAWGAYVAERLAETPQISIEILPEFDAASRSLNIVVSGQAISAIDHEVNLSVLLTENHIQDYQLTPDGKESDYDHKHVLRDVLTTFDGDAISSSMSIGDAYDQTFTYNLPTEWDELNCSVVAFIHRNDSEKTILQVEEVNLAE